LLSSFTIIMPPLGRQYPTKDVMGLLDGIDPLSTVLVDLALQTIIFILPSEHVHRSTTA
jgi:hypothetical protein